MAALVVVGWHLTLAFNPARAGILPGGAASDAFNGRVWFGLLNGPAAVVFFFVLSGYVLTCRALATGETGIILRGMVKRWPRLGGPVLLTAVGAWLLMVLGAPRYAPVAAITGSPWLAGFGNAIAPGTTLVPQFHEAVLQGAVRTFLFGDFTYDSSIWTMRLEFYGSFLVFALALAMIALRGSPRGLTFAALLGCAALAMWVDPTMVGFPVGVWLAWYLLEQQPRLSRQAAMLCGALGLWLAGWSAGYGACAWVARWLGLAIPPELAQAVGAVLIIVAVQGCPALRARLSGPAAGWLGRLSFPIYLVHVPILCSAGCAAYLAVQAVLPAPWPGVSAVLVTLALTLAAAVPLARFDAWWTGRLSGWFAGWFVARTHDGAVVAARSGP